MAPWHEEFERKFEQLDGKITKLRKDCRIDNIAKLTERAALKSDLEDSMNLVDCQIFDLDQNFQLMVQDFSTIQKAMNHMHRNVMHL